MSRTLPRSRVLIAAATLALPLAVVGPSGSDVAADGFGDDDAVVVANRGSGDVSVIDTDTLTVTSFDLPGDAEPMYVNHDRRRNRVLVGDRASNTVVALDDETFDVVGTVPVGDGVFHQWLDPNGRQLWVVGDVSSTVTVVDAKRLEVLSTIGIPADLVGRGGRPHDVFVRGRFAFVSVLGLDDGSGVVLRYSTRTFEESGRIETGGDPHLYVRGGTLYVASQDSATVTTYQVATLIERRTADVPSAHGIWVTRRGEVLVTNIAGGGADAAWDLDRQLRVDDIVDTAVPTPHNLVELDGHVYVTHSGTTADQVSVIDHGRRGFGDSTVVTVGINPFGLAPLDR